ncbi:xanthine dehydrogenase accessory factor [Catenuloplanes nepalensis]|uniref:Xanthine dehydrogenase accessory factor n=1 Tax=Catenuloplanes nepalensis TaxID=587533 RepID=A0ABT9MTR5_9ACTN|nr:XdhC/CoxI family protein [Catenuloplanes nepalensis]MDP9794658.1 xanthine dehydrogenase accessory factor [Catenuloplanes nepalensis]
MRDIAAGLAEWRAAGLRFAIATVVSTWRSAPRPPGAAMAVAETGEVIGSVSGGCVEAAVYELARTVLENGSPVLATYGVADDDAFAVGLTCGGTIEVLVQPDTGLPDHVLSAVCQGRAVATASMLERGEGLGRRIHVPAEADLDGFDRVVADQAAGMLAAGATGVVALGAQGRRVFVQSFAPPPRMIVFGAVDFAAAVARIGKFLGYHVTVCDARPVFTTRRRFPDADEIVVRWPHDYLASTTIDARTVLCVLTHDPKFDVPLLVAALRSPARYIGAMGSRATHDDRAARLRDAGLSDAELARLSSPIGLDLGARTPEETAVSIAAEIIAATWGGSGRPLGDLEVPIHR